MANLGVTTLFLLNTLAMMITGIFTRQLTEESLPYVELLGCWENGLNFTEKELSYFISSPRYEHTFISSRNKTLNLIAQCAKWAQGLGYSVFFLNYHLDVNPSSCLSGSHAGHLYTNYLSSMAEACESVPSSTKAAYAYSVIGTLQSAPLWNVKRDIRGLVWMPQGKTGSEQFATSLKNRTTQRYRKNSLTYRDGPKNSTNIGRQSIASSLSNQTDTTGFFSARSTLNDSAQNIYEQHNHEEQYLNQGQPSTASDSDNQPASRVASENASVAPSKHDDQSFMTLQDLVLPSLASSKAPEKIGKEIDELTFFNDRPSCQKFTENILRNPSFEDSLMENSLSGWICQGESNEPGSGVLSLHSSDHHGDGQYSGRCSKRVASWAGPGQYIGRFLKPNTSYKFSAWVRLETEKYEQSVNTKEALEVWLRYRDRNSNKLHARLLAKTFVPVNDPSWENIFADFHVPKLPKRVKYVFLYMKGPSRVTDILIDDSTLTASPYLDNWKEISDGIIDNIRKRTVHIKLILPNSLYTVSGLSATRIEVKQKTHSFAFGAALSGDTIFTNEKYRKFFLDNFDWAVIENALKWTDTEPSQGVLKYDLPDKIINFLLNNNKSIRGHCIFWDFSENQPKWLLQLPPHDMRDALERRLDNIVLRYKGKLAHWDVNNEMLHGAFYATTLQDPSIRQWMYHRVKELDPAVKVFLNDFDVVENSLFTKQYLDLAQELLAQNVPIDGLGAQGHFTGVVDPFLLKERLDLLMETNLPIWLTEVDIVEPDPFMRARSLENVVRVGFSHPGVHGIVFWCFWSKKCWRGPDTAFVEGDDFKLTEAGQVYLDLRRQWTTNDELKPIKIKDNEGRFVFRGFHGDYDMFIYLPDGQIITKNFTVKPGKSSLALRVRVFSGKE